MESLKLSEEDRQKYTAVGVGLYVKDMEERYHVTMAPEFWRGVTYTGLNEEEIGQLITALKERGISSGKEFDDFLQKRILPGSEQYVSMYQMLSDYFQQIGDVADVPYQINSMIQKYQEHKND